MHILRKNFGIGVMTVTLLIGVTPGVFAQGIDGGPASAASSAGAKGVIKLRASVVCASCSLEEAQQKNPSQTDLYELTHEEGKVVIRVNSVNDSTSSGNESGDVPNRWSSIGQPAQLAVRAEDRLFQMLIDQKNREKELEITGVIRTTRTLDISEITIIG